MTNTKTAIVTGATSGIGYITARELARQGFSVIMAVRDEKKADFVTKRIIADIPGAHLEILLCDLSSQKSIRDFAAAFKARHARLDVLVNNAGGIWPKRLMTEDTIEMTFAVNHLGPFLLTNLLMPMLKASRPSRVVTVASLAEKFGKIWFDDVNLQRGWTDLKAYAQSKLANIMFTYELARILQGAGVSAYCLHPGIVATGFGHRGFSPLNVWTIALRPFVLTAERGAATSIYLASSPEVEGVSGKYYINCKVARSSGRSYDEAAQEKLWELSERMTGMGL